MDKRFTDEDIINVAKCCRVGNCKSCPLENDEKCATNFLNCIIEYMENKPAPAADVQEVKHGKWLKPSNEPVDSKQWICSECKGLTETAYYCWHCYYNYCPNCGTRMDGDSNG